MSKEKNITNNIYLEYKHYFPVGDVYSSSSRGAFHETRNKTSAVKKIRFFRNKPSKS